ncbi:hypothetical protein [Streptomyces sp. R41]|uniref:Uncharacterized protein n=1 Tax=Streptomyces sp. R41 TaxID=3238632 RepID=A0AB39R5B3_9ACTN
MFPAHSAALLLAVDRLVDFLGGGAQGVEFGGVEDVEDEVAYPGYVSWGGFGEVGVAGFGQDRLGVAAVGGVGFAASHLNIHESLL